MTTAINQYLQQFRKPSTGWQSKLEEEAKQDSVPIMEREGIDFLKQLLRLRKPTKILEIGSGIGYSALQMSEAVPNSAIVTVERDQVRAERARNHFEHYDGQSKIDLIIGDAFECEDEISQRGPYDLLFIDAAKAQYRHFFERFVPYLTAQGIVITDNVLFHGYVADSTIGTNNQQKIAHKINHYNHWLNDHSDFHTEFVSIGDGIAISIKSAPVK